MPLMEEEFHGRMNPMLSPTEQLYLRQRAIQLSIYLDVMLSILAQVESVSATKLLILSFFLKTGARGGSDLLNGRYRKSLFERAACEASGRFGQMLRELPYGAESLKMLVDFGLANVSSGVFSISAQGESMASGLRDAFQKRLIDEAVRLDDAYVLMEVLRNV